MKNGFILLILLCSLLIMAGCESKDSSSKSESSEVKNTIVFDSSDIKVELNASGDALLTYDGIDAKDKKIASNVSSTAIVHAGQSDVCEGNERLIFIMKDGSISYLNIDKLVCGSELEVKNNIGGYEDIAAVYDEQKKVNDYEPVLYTVYARDKDGLIYNITDALN